MESFIISVIVLCIFPSGAQAVEKEWQRIGYKWKVSKLDMLVYSTAYFLLYCPCEFAARKRYLKWLLLPHRILSLSLQQFVRFVVWIILALFVDLDAA